MKPTKNRVFCPECRRKKMLFETEKKALLFMRYNNEEISQESDTIPQRAYYCMACGGWHLTHLSDPLDGPSRTEEAIAAYNTEIIEKRKIKSEKTQKKVAIFELLTKQTKRLDELVQNGNNNDALNLISLMEREIVEIPKVGSQRGLMRIAKIINETKNNILSNSNNE